MIANSMWDSSNKTTPYKLFHLGEESQQISINEIPTAMTSIKSVFSTHIQ